MNVDTQVLDLVAKAYKVDASEVLPESEFSVLGKESMKMIALLASIENELDVEVPLREGMLFKTVAELIARVEEEA